MADLPAVAKLHRTFNLRPILPNHGGMQMALGRRRGVIFCRFQLVKGNLKPLETELVKLSELS